MQWQTAEQIPELKENQIHIWRISLSRQSSDIPMYYNLLDSQEKERADRYKIEKAADDFIISRATLRTLIGQYLGQVENGIVFHQNKHGKLYLKSSPLHFNVSHSGDLAVFIFALDVDVGIDVEFMKDNFDFLDIAKRFFPAKENKELLVLPKEQQRQAFFNCWSCKEAFIKGIGTGLYTAFSDFSVEISTEINGKIELTQTISKKDWSLEQFNPGEKYSGAFAVGALDYEVSFFDLY